MEKTKQFKFSKRILSVVLTVMLLIGGIYLPSMPSLTVSAASQELPPGFVAYGGSGYSGIGGYFDHAERYILGRYSAYEGFNNSHIPGWDRTHVFMCATLNDHRAVYCIEPAQHILGSYWGFTPSSYGPSHRITLSETQITMLQYALAYGQQFYSNVTHNGGDSITIRGADEIAKGAATQIIVWSIAAQGYTNIITDITNRLNAIKDDNPTRTAFCNYIDEIWGKIQNAMKMPSFTSLTSPGPSYTAKWSDTNDRYEITLTDTDSALSTGYWPTSAWKVISGNSLGFSVSGNNLAVTGDPGISGTTIAGQSTQKKAVILFLNPRKGRNSSGGDLETMQQMITCEIIPEDNPVYCNIKRDEMVYDIQKTIVKSDANWTPNLSGFEFKIWKGTNSSGTAVTKKTGANPTIFTTGSDGKIQLRESDLNNFGAGTYYVEEQLTEDKKEDGYYYHAATGTFTVSPRTDIDPSPSNIGTKVINNKEIEIELEKEIDSENNAPIEPISKAGYYFNVYKYGTAQ
ncbi:MAG: prealbumin-like fold domain-containing protein, partial [Oscillospiraceae bacterium]|nr:prealbumin-like fold domain-containing protein [Oscillospiraceae bacterium]